VETQRSSAEATSIMHIAITGSHGLIGGALSTSLRAAGHNITQLGRTGPYDLAGVDAVVNLAGEPIGAKRWSDDQKRKILESRRDITRAVADAVVAAKVPVLLQGSAIGVYGDRGDEVLTEASPAGTGFLAEVAMTWEAAAQPAVDAGARVAFLRTGIVLTSTGGALKSMLPLFKLGLGGRMGTGRQWMSWIGLDDEVAAIKHVLTSDVRGPVNLTAPEPSRQGDLAKTLGRVLHRPTVLPTPSFGPRLLLGKELSETLLGDSQRVEPGVLTKDGFRFAHPDLESALTSLLR
jgi:uncharacterized protein (TIGR01777 family)